MVFFVTIGFVIKSQTCGLIDVFQLTVASKKLVYIKVSDWFWSLPDGTRLYRMCCEVILQNHFTKSFNEPQSK